MKTKNAPDSRKIPCQGRIIQHYPRYHLASQVLHLCPQQDTNISPANHVCLQRRSILRPAKAVFPAPSAVHLTSRVSPGSQLPKLSVKASLPLSPLQRFEVLNCPKYTTPLPRCQPAEQVGSEHFSPKNHAQSDPFFRDSDRASCLAEFRQDAGINCNLKKLAACTSVFSLLRRVSVRARRVRAPGCNLDKMLAFCRN